MKLTKAKWRLGRTHHDRNKPAGIAAFSGLIGLRVVAGNGLALRPEVAQTLVGLGLGLHAMVTRGTLESGVAYALTQTGARLVVEPERRAILTSRRSPP